MNCSCKCATFIVWTTRDIFMDILNMVIIQMRVIISSVLCVVKNCSLGTVMMFLTSWWFLLHFLGFPLLLPHSLCIPVRKNIFRFFKSHHLLNSVIQNRNLQSHICYLWRLSWSDWPEFAPFSPPFLPFASCCFFKFLRRANSRWLPPKY